jgi:predicted dehydrogenase
VADGTPPAELDYDFWIGPAPMRPFNKNRVHYLFRFFWDYSGGQMTNFGAHDLDITQWGLGMDESGPTTIEAEARYNKDKWFETPEWLKIDYTYANGVKVTCQQTGPDGKNSIQGGVTFYGEKGHLHVNRSSIMSEPGEIAKEQIKETEIHLYASKNHHANWLECITSRKLPICDVEIGHRSATVCHLGNIAIRTGRKITWDPVKEQIVGDEEANAMTDKEYRSPWKLV